MSLLTLNLHLKDQYTRISNPRAMAVEETEKISRTVCIDIVSHNAHKLMLLYLGKFAYTKTVSMYTIKV